MNAILVCVDYSDILSITLPYNRHHFNKVVVVTSPKDLATYEVAMENKATPFITNAFYENGASFNKWKALEQGLDYLGRQGWLCIMDADVLWPKKIPVRANSNRGGVSGKIWVEEFCDFGYLYTPRRRMMVDLSKPIPEESQWKEFPLHPQEVEWAGYSQIFHASDPILGTAPWHETNWIHAGGADSFFQDKWPKHKKIRPEWQVLHLGPAGQNWLGRTSPYIGGRVPEGAEEKRNELREMLLKRRHNPLDRFGHEKIAEE